MIHSQEKSAQFPMVFASGKYTVKVGEPGTERQRVLRGLQPNEKKEETLTVEWP